MKRDREQKRTILGEHLPDFPGYRAIDQGETDLQLRRYLAGEMEKVRDRLAAFIAGGELGDCRQAFAEALRKVAALKEKFIPPARAVAETQELPAEDEERLLDLDIALLDKVAALHTPIDRMESAAAATELRSALEQFCEGLAEASHLFRQRGEILRGNSAGEEKGAD
ncbi:MAG: hypothetical protein WDA20_14565 [Desulfuromonadales bacterium]|jgi:hypothetical protein